MSSSSIMRAIIRHKVVRSPDVVQLPFKISRKIFILNYQLKISAFFCHKNTKVTDNMIRLFELG